MSRRELARLVATAAAQAHAKALGRDDWTDADWKLADKVQAVVLDLTPEG